MNKAQVIYEPTGKSLPDRLVKEVVGALQARLDASDFEGAWIVRPIRLTGRGDQGLVIRRVTKDSFGKECIEIHCRIGDRRFAWMFYLYTPESYVPRDIVAVLTGERATASTTSLPEPKMPEREPAIGQVVLARVTQVKPYGITVRVEPYGIDGFVDISDFNGDVDAIRACEDYLVPGDGGRYKNVKVQYIGKTRDVHKFSIAGATISTGDGHGDMFNPVGRKDGTIVLVGFTKKSTNRLKVLKWLAEEGRKYHPRAIPRDAALDAVTIGLMEEFGGEPQRKVVGVVLHAIIDRPNEPWVTLDNERNIIITEGGWSLAAINGIVPPWMSPHGKPTELAVEEPQEPQEELQEPQEELQEPVVENRPVEKVAAKLDIAEYIRKTARLAVILAEKAEIEAWLRENHDEILGLVSTPPQSQK